MSSIVLTNQALKAGQCGINDNQSTMYPYMLNLVGNGSSTNNFTVLNQLRPAPISRELTNLSLSLGGDNVMALSEMMATLRDYNLGMIGASASTYENRVSGFVGSVRDYQSALMQYRRSATSGSPTHLIAKQRAHAAFQKMQMQFRHELNAINATTHSRRGTPLTSAERATNIARSSRNAAKLNVTSQVQADNLVKFAKHAKYLGNGLAVIDFGSRVGNIHNSYQAGGNWERDLFIESSSFAASASVGILTANIGTSALGLLVMATPIGWVGLITGGLIVAGASATSAIMTNSYLKENSGGWYDWIMEQLRG